MEHFGIVLEDKGETAVVIKQPHVSCESCGRCGILSASGNRETTVEALNPVQAKVGQRVVLETDDRQMLFVSFMLYMVPLFGLIAGIFGWLALADYLALEGDRELTAILVGIGFLAVVFYFIRLWDRKARNNPKYKPVITGIVTGDTDCQANH